MKPIVVVAGSLLVQALASCAGGGSQPLPSSVLFVADIADGAIASFPELNPPAGSTVAGRVISGISSLGESVAYDAQRDYLYATSAGTVVVYHNASTAAGRIAPTRVITPVGTAFTLGPMTLFLDKNADALYVGGNIQYDGGAVVVFSHASSASGVLAPDRVMTVGEGVNFFTIDTSRSILYVLNSLVGVHVFENSSTASGTISAVRDLDGPIGLSTGLAVDPARDRLYLADVFAGVHFVNGASTASGFPAYGTVPIATSQFVTLDGANDRLYVGAYDKAYILNGASSLVDGSLSPSAVRAMAPAGASIAGFAFP